MSRLLNSFAQQTVQSDQIVLVVNAGYHLVGDNLLFDSRDDTVNDWNGFLETSKPSQLQMQFWHTFMKQIGALTQAACLRQMHDVRYQWAGIAPDDERGKQGPSVNRLRALELVKNEWVAYFDDDDLMHPRRTEFLWTAIQSDTKDLDAMYQATSMFALNTTEAAADLLSWWHDPFVIVTDRNDIPQEYRSLPQDIQAHFNRNYSEPISVDLRDRIAAARQIPLVDHPHVSWQDAITRSIVPNLANTCAAVLQGGPKPSFDDDRAIKEGDATLHSDVHEWGSYLNSRYAENLVWKANLTDSHVPSLSNGGNTLIHAGWITVKKQIFKDIKPIDSKHDDNTYQFWRMNHVCRKTRFNYNVIGLYLKPSPNHY